MKTSVFIFLLNVYFYVWYLQQFNTENEIISYNILGESTRLVNKLSNSSRF